VDLYIHSAIRLHGVVLNYLSTGNLSLQHRSVLGDHNLNLGAFRGAPEYNISISKKRALIILLKCQYFMEITSLNLHRQCLHIKDDTPSI
jgi:hypothetical protein